MEKLKIELAEAVNSVLGDNLVAPADFSYPPEDASKADLALPCFKLAPKMKSNPQELAKKIAAAVKSANLNIAHSENAYVNFYLNRKAISREILAELTAGVAPETKKEKILLEYVSPNSNKPLHLGHIRNGFLGEAMANILTLAGYKVKRSCLVNDRGIAICKSMLAYEKWGNGDTPKKAKMKSDHFVGHYYVMFDKQAKENPQLIDEAQEMLRKYEARDRKTVELWKKMSKWALDGYKETYAKLGIAFDKVYFESELFEDGRELAQEGLKNNLFYKDEKGNIAAKLEDCNLPDKILLRADGTAVYATTDLALAKRRIDDGFHKIYYVVGSEQDLYFKQLFCVLQKMKLGEDLEFKHLSYGMVVLPEGRMKSREGTVVDADDLAAKMEELAAEEIRERDKEISESEVARRSRVIASSALKFYILNVKPETMIHFNPKESLAFTGKTGPYLLYAYARLHSVWRKGQAKTALSALDFSLMEDEKIWNLLFEAAKFNEELAAAAEQLNPEKITHFLYEVADRVSAFYHDAPILEAPVPERQARIFIIRAILDLMETGFALLGFEPLDEM